MTIRSQSKKKRSRNEGVNKTATIRKEVKRKQASKVQEMSSKLKAR